MNDDIIRDRLENMAGWASTRRSRFSDIQAKNAYVRIGGNGFRAVSVAAESPLTGYGNNSVKLWSTVCDHLAKYSPAVVKGKKEERRLQAYMIRSALQTPGNSLTKLVGDKIAGIEFDDVLFAFDEISLGDKNQKVRFNKPINGKSEGIIRCDLLCVGVKEGKGYPIIIELKYDRELKRLFEQLNEFSLFITDHYKEEFSKLLMAATGVKVDCDHCYKALVWPGNENESDSTKKTLKENDIQVIEYKVSETIPDVDGDVLKTASFVIKTYE